MSIMKIRKEMRSFIACMLVLLLSTAFTLPFFARTAKAADTTYTVRVFSGERGSFSGKKINEVKTFSGLKYDDKFSFKDHKLTKNSVTVMDKKYYVRGFRESGKDNNTIYPETFKVTGDVDYVVAYGVAGSTVEYNVNYVDEDGNTLAPSETFYGNVGDKPVVAYEYIEGYFPQARNLTKTLSDNAANNSFTFVYQQIEQEEPTTEATTQATTQATTRAQQQTTQAPPAGQTTIIERTVPAATTAAPATPTAPAATTAAANTTAPAADTGVADNDDLPDNEDEVPDLVDIDDQDTPLADYTGTTTETEEPEETTEVDVLDDNDTPRGLSTAAKVGIGIGSVVAIAAAAGALYYFLVYRGYDDDDEDEDDEE